MRQAVNGPVQVLRVHTKLRIVRRRLIHFQKPIKSQCVVQVPPLTRSTQIHLYFLSTMVVRDTRPERPADLATPADVPTARCATHTKAIRHTILSTLQTVPVARLHRHQVPNTAMVIQAYANPIPMRVWIRAAVHDPIPPHDTR
jgi:hypothetical protein